MVDIDGVISLFGPPGDRGPEGSFHAIDGIPHFLSAPAAAHLLGLVEAYDLVWASGWEEKAEEYLPHLLGLPAGLPFLRFARMTGPPPTRAGRSIEGHWKLDAIDAYAGGRPLAWIDDAFDRSCHAWADQRPAPTLLVETDPSLGLTSREAQLLAEWALAPARPPVAAPS
jgi:HAD domain in Swiss Army Knife RNA repair proteins